MLAHLQHPFYYQRSVAMSLVMPFLMELSAQNLNFIAVVIAITAVVGAGPAIPAYVFPPFQRVQRVTTSLLSTAGVKKDSQRY